MNVANIEEFAIAVIRIIDSIPPFVILFVHSLVISTKLRHCNNSIQQSNNKKEE